MRPTPEILREYELRRRRALTERDERERAAYMALPRLQAIDEQKRDIALSLGRALLCGGCREELDKAAREGIAALNAERAGLMKASGLKPDYFEPHFLCAACRDTGYTDNSRSQMCDCLKQRLLQAAYASSNTETGETFEAFRTDIFASDRQRKLTVKAKELLESFADSFPDNPARDVLLVGAAGLGKTYLANCVAQRVLERGYTAVKLTAYNLVDGYLVSLRSRTAPPNMTDTDLLVIDDLGAEPMIPNITVEYLFSIINERQTAKRGTVIATNLSPNDIMDRYGERLFSRITSGSLCNVIQLEGDDIRKQL